VSVDARHFVTEPSARFVWRRVGLVAAIRATLRRRWAAAPRKRS